MEPAQPGFWLSDRLGWAIFATGVVAIFGLYYVAFAFGDYGVELPTILERRLFLGRMLFAVGAFAVSGPFAVMIGQFFCSPVRRSLGRKLKPTGLEDL
jgi:hypothetical protein